MSYSANDNQNVFVQSGKTTSRVLSQPGGTCSISLGGWTADELQKQRELKEQKRASKQVEKPIEKVNKENDEIVLVKVPVEKKQEIREEVKSAQKGKIKTAVSSNAFASGSTTNSFNVLTDRPTSRVIAPPGGHTSIRLG